MVRAMKNTMYKTKLSTKRAKGFANGVVTGLASLLTIATPHQTSFRSKVESSESALRGDFVRIGADMRKAAAKEVAREKAAR